MGDRIDAVAANADLRTQYPDDDVIDASGHVLAPGFVNAHTHLYGVLAHGIPLTKAPSDFWAFLADFWWPLVEDALDHAMICAATDWVCAEMLRSGVTSFYDCLEAPFAIPDALFAQKEVVERRGLRGILSFEATERVSKANGQVGLQENAQFIDHFDVRSNLAEKAKLSILFSMINIAGIEGQIERVDELPVLFGLLKQMGIQSIIDEVIEVHGNWQGLSPGWVVLIWLMHVLSEQNHLMEPVQRWGSQHLVLLRSLSKQEVKELDFTDDRLALCLLYLHHHQDWQRIKEQLGARLIRVYDLETGLLRIDATVGTVHHNPAEHTLFQWARRKPGSTRPSSN